MQSGKAHRVTVRHSHPTCPTFLTVDAESAPTGADWPECAESALDAPTRPPVRGPRLRPVTFRLYDTATRAVHDFVPLEEGRAGIYVCGLTVQSEPHVGHVRSAVNFDVLRRWLTHRGHDVTFIRNVTDIDDKILTKAAEQGRPWFNLAYEMHGKLTEALASINVCPRPTSPARPATCRRCSS